MYVALQTNQFSMHSSDTFVDLLKAEVPFSIFIFSQCLAHISREKTLTFQ